MAFGDRLRLARARSGLSMAALAAKADDKITAQAINKYEKGEMMPKSSVLVALARALDVSLDFLMAAEVVALDGVEFRKRASATERDKAFVEAEVIDHVERYLSIEAVLSLPEEGSAFDRIKPVTIERIEEAEQHAQKLRRDWNIGGDPIPSMTALLEERGVRVIEIEGPEKFFGLTCRVRRPEGRPAIPVIVRRHVNVERDRFTVAHEVAHAVIAESGDGRTEKAMDRFAAAFLMPADHLRNELGDLRSSLGYQELVRLKHLYGVSMMALIMRLKDLGIISEASLKNLYRSPARAWLKQEPEQLNPKGEIGQLEKPRRFESHVYRALAEGLISAVHAANLLKATVHDVEAALQGPGA